MLKLCRFDASRGLRRMLLAVSMLTPGAAYADMDMAHMGGMHAPPSTCADLTLRCAATVTPFVAGDNRLWIVARAADRLFVVHSDDRGKTFSAAVAIDTGPVTLDWGPDARPKIVVARNGTVIVAYAIFRDKMYNGEVFTTRSTDGGKTFAPVTPITDVQESQRFVAMAFDADGSLFSAWLDKRDRVAARAQGKPYPGAGLAFAWSHDEGRTFDPARIAFDDTCECCRLAVAFKAPGRPVVLFRDIFPGGIRDHAVVTFDDPHTPGLLRRVAVDDWVVNACPHQGPSLAIAGDGSYHATWFTLGKARQGLFYARSTDEGRHFSDPMPLGPSGQVLSRPFVFAVDTTIRLVWKAFDGQKTNVMAMTSNDDGVSWGAARVVASTEKASDHPLLVRLDGQVYLSWQTGEGYRLIPMENRA